MEISIEGISGSPSILKDVIKLYRSYSKFLGFFPKGAFEQHAENDEILLALSMHDRSLMGYLLFRRSMRNHTISITHVCVSQECMGDSVADKLIEELKGICRKEGCAAISLNCREDYVHAKKLWERNYFFPITEGKGKNTEGYKLFRWVWENTDVEDLFGFYSSGYEDKVKVVIDANIIIKYREGGDDLIKFLMGDWLSDEVEIFYTPEFLVEISRSKDEGIRNKSREIVSKISKVSVADSSLNEAYNIISRMLPPVKTIQDESDRKQLAYSCAFDASFFVSADGVLVDNAQCVSDSYGILVYRPEEFFLYFDSHLNGDAYNPSRLEGSAVSISKVNYKELNRLEGVFLRRDKSELSKKFRERLQKLLGRTDQAVFEKVITDGELKALLGYSIEENCLSVSFLRIVNHKDSITLSMQLVEILIKSAVDSNVGSVVVLDEFHAVSKRVLNQFGFLLMDGRWIKLVGSGVVSHEDVEILLSRGSDVGNDTIRKYCQYFSSDKYGLERALWPLKFSDLNLPVYVIPILKNWAMNLFDSEIAERDLFGSIPSLAFNYENIYYSASNIRIKFPSRVLWYIKKDCSCPESGYIRAVSYIDQVKKGGPKELFREFKRLGVYEWKNIIDLAKNELENEITAILFSRTEYLDSPVSFEDFQLIHKNQIQGPLSIPHKSFLDMYAGKVGKNSYEK